MTRVRVRARVAGRRSLRRRLITAVTALVTAIAPIAALPVISPASAATAPTVHTVSYQCDTSKPGYGTNSTGNAYFDVNVGDFIDITMNGGSCRQGGMHIMGVTSQISWNPANTSCCAYIPSGTTYRVSVLNRDPSSNGGWIAVPFFGTTYGGIEQVKFKIYETPKVPAPPVNLAGAPSDTSVSLSFTKPDTFGLALDYYEVQVNGGAWQKLANPPVVESLTPSTDYTFRVRAVSSAGAGAPSELVTSRTTAQVTGVTRTINFQCDVTKPNYGTNDSGGDITTYVGERFLLRFNGPSCYSGDMHIMGEAAQLAISPPLPKSCCSAMANGAAVVVDVVKYLGWNDEPGWVRLPFFRDNYGSAEGFGLAVASPLPPAPIITKTTRVGENIVVEFTQPESKFPITGYEWSTEFDEAYFWNTKWKPATTSGSPITVPTMDKQYPTVVGIRAVSSAGAGKRAFTTAAATKLSPGQPTNPEATPGDRQVVLNWTPSTPGSAEVKDYLVEVYSYATSRVPRVQALRVPSGPVTITGLTNGVKYRFDIQAWSADGLFSRWSDDIYAVPERAPVVVDICHAVDDGYEKIALSFNPDKGDQHYGHSGDIIPPVAGRAGVNWDEKGTATFDNGCVEVKPIDTDKDGVIDLEDADDDGDGVPDVYDSDDDGDRTPDASDPDQPMKADTDGDGVPNALDSDDDGDGIADAVDQDSDGDRIDDNVDGDVQLPTDTDRDGTPDAVDPDDDGDCIADAKDADRDGDGVVDTKDSDLDNDGIPNSVDRDDDGDGVPDAVDADANGDGGTDSIEANEGNGVQTRTGLKPRAGQCSDALLEDDNADTDGDGRPNATDKDDDGDGTPDTKDSDQDGDGIPNTEDEDSDGDGIVNVDDRDSTVIPSGSVVDTDGDGVPNATDKDDDGDGVPDVRDGDADGDGQPETTGQVLLSTRTLPVSLPANGQAVLLTGRARTNAGQPVVVQVECTPVGATMRMKGTGDVSASSLRSCRVEKKDGKVVLTTRSAGPMKVTVRTVAPAAGEYLRLEQVRTYTVG